MDHLRLSERTSNSGQWLIVAGSAVTIRRGRQLCCLLDDAGCRAGGRLNSKIRWTFATYSAADCSEAGSSTKYPLYLFTPSQSPKWRV